MVMVVESMVFKEGKGKEARELLKKLGSHAKKTFRVEYQTLERMTPQAGEGARLLFLSTFESLGAWGEYQKKLEGDPQWQALMEEGFRSEKKLFVHNTFSRTIFQVT